MEQFEFKVAPFRVKNVEIINPDDVDYESDEVLLTYDGSVELYTFVDSQGQRWLGYMWDRDNESHRWMYSQISDQELISLKNNEIPLYSLLFKEPTIVRATFSWKEKEPKDLWWDSSINIPYEFRPQKGVFLYSQIRIPLIQSTAIYPNRWNDRAKLDQIMNLEEFGSSDVKLFTNGELFSEGYERIVFGDHGPYIEFTREQIKQELFSKFGNNINELPDENCQYYYLWLYPKNNQNLKVYWQIKPVTDLPNAPKRDDGKPHKFNRKEGYADYKRGYYYVNPYDLSKTKDLGAKDSGKI